MLEAKYAGDPFCFCDILLIFIYGHLADIFSLIYNLGEKILKLFSKVSIYHK